MKRYSIIYADPPWQFHTWSDKGKSRSAERHYPTMSLKDIVALPVHRLAADDCVLFLWATAPCLRNALLVMDCWGFAYKTVAFTWVKKNRKSEGLFWGMGYWTRANAEYCLLGVKGSPARVDAGVHSVVISPVREHSRKPDEVRERIVRLMGDLPRIELCARQATPGWSVWGNEVQNTVDFSKEDL